MCRAPLVPRCTPPHEPSAERALLPTSRGKECKRALMPTALILFFAHSKASRPTLFRSAARGPHAPAELTRVPTQREARKRRTSERPRVGCCEELAGGAIRAK